MRNSLMARLGTAGVALLVVVTQAAPAAAHEHAPRVLSPHNADAYSMKTFAEFPRWRDLKGDAKVYEIYKYLADPRTGIFPMGDPIAETATPASVIPAMARSSGTWYGGTRG